MTTTIKFLLNGNTHAPPFTVQDFDREIFLVLKRRPYLDFVREEVAEAVVFTFADKVGRPGHFAVSPGTDISPQVRLEVCSYIADAVVVASWTLFHSCPYSFRAVTERDASFRDLCRWIYAEFIMKHGLDLAGRPTNVWDDLPREEAISNSGGTVMIVWPRGFPKNHTTIAWHKQVFQLCIELQATYFERWENGDTDDCKPRPSDYRDFITQQTGKLISARRIRSILKWGDAGLYDRFP